MKIRKKKHENKTHSRCMRFENNNLTRSKLGPEVCAGDVIMHQIFVELIYLSSVTR